MSHTQKQAESSLDSAKYAQIAREVLLLEAKELQNTAQKCAHIAWTPIIESIIKATDKGGKLIVCGVGKSGHIGSKIAATLASTGTPSLFPTYCHRARSLPHTSRPNELHYSYPSYGRCPSSLSHTSKKF